MKFVRNLILVLALLLPSVSLAEEDSVFVKDPDDVEVPVKKKPNFFMFPEGFSPLLWGIAVGTGQVQRIVRTRKAKICARGMGASAHADMDESD